MTTKDDGLGFYTTMILWGLAALVGWVIFNCINAMSQMVINIFRFGIGSDEIYTPLEALVYRVVGITIYDSKLIISSILLWGIIFKFYRKINETWKYMVLSISATYMLVVFAFIFLSRTKLDIYMFTSNVTGIYIALLTPRLIFNKLKAGGIRLK